MGKMISTTEELSELLAEEDCAKTEPADAASKGRRVRCAMVIRVPERCDYARLLALQFLSSSQYRIKRKTEICQYLLWDRRVALGCSIYSVA